MWVYGVNLVGDIDLEPEIASIRFQKRLRLAKVRTRASSIQSLSTLNMKIR